ncbi:MAG: TIGR03936 family radical SAM-associated protein [Phycisphaerales bacterium]
MHIVVANGAILLVIKFRISGSLRFLSHAETVRLFQRACTRAGLNIQYSRGFNPRPKLSLPLPRPVGIASDDELLCFRMNCTPGEPQAADYESQIKDGLSARLPEGCEMLSVSIADAKTSFQPCSATYIISVRSQYVNEQLKVTIERLLASDNLSLERRIHKKNLKLKTQNSKLKNVDVRSFLKSIDLQRNDIMVNCEINPSGSIRVDEILKLLELDMEKLVLPIRRTSVKWRCA